MASAAINTVHVAPSPSPPFLHLRRQPDPPSPDFEFRPSPTANSDSMLPADQLISGGFLLPLRHPSPPPPPPSLPPPPETPRSPKAPRCSSRWKELFGLKRAAQRAASTNPRNSKLRSPKSSSDPLSIPLLRDLDIPPKDKPQVSEKTRAPANRRGRREERGGGGGGRVRWASVDSPRVSSTGRVVFQNLGRSSSSPGNFAGGGSGAAVGGRRSFSGVRFVAAPILNVGLGQLLFSPQKKEVAPAGNGVGGGGGCGGRSGFRR